MNILSIPLRNLGRKPLRAALMTLVFAAGVAAVTALALVSRTVGEDLEKKLSAYGANILVAPKTETLDVGYGGLRLGAVSHDVKAFDEEQALAAIRSIHHKDRLSAVAPRFVLSARVADVPVGVLGVDFGQEMGLRSYWRVTGTPPQGPGDILAGSRATEKLGLAPDDQVAAAGRTFRVSGVLDPTGGPDDALLFADLASLQAAAGKPGVVHFVEVAALCSGCPIEEITDQLSAALPDADISAMRRVVEERMTTVAFVKSLALWASLVILLTAAVMIGLSISAAVGERTRDIGLLRAIGFSRPNVFAVFSLEALAMGLAAGLIGHLCGLAGSAALMDALGMAAGGGQPPPWELFILSPLAAGLLAAAASVHPALKAARVEPSKALVAL